MQNPTIFIDDNLLQQISNKKNFEITVYDYFLYLSICVLTISVSGLFFYQIIHSGNSFLLRICLGIVIFIFTILGLRIFIRSFINSFYFKKITTNLKSNACVNLLASLFDQQGLSYQKGNNIKNIIICMEYYAYSKSIIETTIIVLDDYLLVNTRNRNTSIISLHTSKISDFLNTYFRANKYHA